MEKVQRGGECEWDGVGLVCLVAWICFVVAHFERRSFCRTCAGIWQTAASAGVVLSLLNEQFGEVVGMIHFHMIRVEDADPLTQSICHSSHHFGIGL